ncbi:hypothetical protein OTU49_010746 [Cherax quadricarinatus]|uniref:Lipocalin n=1 Tax=Cherax quadricarinatus TaxID=27406 RepID=A0AAW0W6N3_CHEQU|nr:uncharacterized protein LOC128702268 [Cherax quadricarinatus]
MRASTELLIVFLLCLAAAVPQEAKDGQDAKISDRENAKLSDGQNVNSTDEQDAKFFIKSYSTTTWTFLSSFTSTVPYTCYTTAAGVVACRGRRMRNSKRLFVERDADTFELLSSISGDDVKEDDRLSESEKFFFTLWRTSSSTVTVTTYSTNRSVTVSVSVMCTYPGVALNFC